MNDVVKEEDEDDEEMKMFMSSNNRISDLPDSEEEYVAGGELGKLDCGHEFHFNCIEQWLMLKNACPLCKRAVVAI